MTDPFIKWAGGKRQLVDRLLPIVARRLTGRYLEPFLGGGAVAVHLASDHRLRDVQIVASDVCAELVTTWRVVIDQPLVLGQLLERLAETHSERMYYQVRSVSPTLDLDVAARFIYLNKMGYNGLYRVNASGGFNVPLGRGRPSSIPTREALHALASKLGRRCQVDCRDFEATIDEAQRGDVVYADPPYDGTFSYSSKFGDADRARLALALGRAVDRGASVVATDADTPYVRALYDSWARVELIGERRRVSCKSTERRVASCVLVTA